MVLRLDPALAERLRLVAEVEGRSISEVAREAVAAVGTEHLLLRLTGTDKPTGGDVEMAGRPFVGISERVPPWRPSPGYAEASDEIPVAWHGHRDRPAAERA